MNLYSSSDHRLKRCIVLFVFLLPVAVYISCSLSALYCFEVNLNNLEQYLNYCLYTPYFPEKFNEKTPACIGIGVIVWMVAFAMAYSKAQMRLIHGAEHGTASWGSFHEFNKKYAAQDESENKILSENVRMTYAASTLRNNNMFVIGGSGAGKTAFLATPNLLNMHDSNVYTDPKGGLLEDFGEYLKHQPNTRVYNINLCEMEKSMRFNPFPFIRQESDIPKLIRNIMSNTTPAETPGSTDPFWDKAESMYLQSIFYYVWKECPTRTIGDDGEEILERNFKSVLKLLDEAKISEDGEESPLDIRFALLEARQPKHIAIRTYHRFKQGAGDTMRSIIICANSRFNAFDNEELLRILSDNDIPLDEIGTGVNGDGITKSYLFLIIPDDDDTYNFVPGMIYTLLFQELYRQSRFYEGNKLPLDVGFWFDEFANIKMPSNFEKILATCRSRGIYCVPILQSLAQIKKIYKDGAWEGVIGNCDTIIYLGGNEQSSHKYISEMLGKWTADKMASGESKGTQGSFSQNYDVIGRDLIDSAEMRLLPNEKCIIFVRGEKPLIDRKWHPWEHDIYKKAKSYGKYKGNEQIITEDVKMLSDLQVDYFKTQATKNKNIIIYEDLDPLTFLRLNPDELCKEDLDDNDMEELLQLLSETDIERMEREEAEKEKETRIAEFMLEYEAMSMLEILSSSVVEPERKECISQLAKLGIDEATIKRQVALDIPMKKVKEVVEVAKQYYEATNT